MKLKSIGIVGGGGGPIGSASILQEIIAECQRTYGSWRSYEYPCLNFYSYPYSEMMLVRHNSSSIPSRELSYCIQQLKLMGMEIIVIPCFTMCSYLTFRKYDVELIEMAPIVQSFLKENDIKNPLILCSGRTRNSGYCDRFFECRYPNTTIQKELDMLIEEALRGEKIDISPLLFKLPYVPIVCAATALNAQMLPVKDPRLINPNRLLAQYVVQLCYEGTWMRSHTHQPELENSIYNIL